MTDRLDGYCVMSRTALQLIGPSVIVTVILTKSLPLLLPVMGVDVALALPRIDLDGVVDEFFVVTVTVSARSSRL